MKLEARDLYDEFTSDLDNPIDERYTHLMTCPICGKEIAIRSGDTTEVYNHGGAYGETYHWDCVEWAITFDNVVKFLEATNEWKDFFNWFYRDYENPIAELPEALKDDLLTAIKNKKDVDYYINQYITENQLSEYLEWYNEEVI